MYVHTKTVGFFFFFHFKCACHRFPLVNCCLSVFRSVHSCICTYVLWDFYLQVTSEHLLLRRCFYWHVGRFIDLFVVALFVKFFFFSSKKKNTNCVWNLYECMHSGNLPKWQRNVRNWAWEQLTISFFFFSLFFFLSSISFYISSRAKWEMFFWSQNDWDKSGGSMMCVHSDLWSMF